MGLYARFLRRVGDRPWFAAVASRAAPGLDRAVYRLTRGRRLATPAEVPTLFLTTRGRRTGLLHRVAVSYIELPEGRAVAATNWGKARLPHWAMNLLAEPRAVIEIHGVSADVVAEEVGETDRARVWAALDEMWPAFAAYRRRAARRAIPLFVLKPR